MKNVKQMIKLALKYLWEWIKMAFPSFLVYASAGSVLLMLTAKKESTLVWDNTKLLWTVVCWVGGIAYNVLVSRVHGGVGYDMLVAGNKRRRSESEGLPIRMSDYNELLEYRAWKGFVVGCLSSLAFLIMGLFFGKNGQTINEALNQSTGMIEKGVGIGTLVGFFISGLTVLPCLFLNNAGVSISYYYTLFFRANSYFSHGI